MDARARNPADQGKGPDRLGGPGQQSQPDQRGCTILHVDMDAFFVSVELRERPELVGRPVIVGFPAGRSVVLSASYEARAMGVHSAMPMANAMRICPQAAVIEPKHNAYYEVSTQVMGIFNSVTDLVEPLSVDEAFLDVSGAIRRLGQPLEIGAMIRARVASELGITASVGIASSKFVAKIASTRCKPNGMLLIPKDRTVEYLHTLPVQALWGVGAKTVTLLAKLGIRTVADVAATPLPVLQRALGKTGQHVYNLSWGIDSRPVSPVRVEKSISAESTFAVDSSDESLLTRELLRLAHKVAVRLRQAGLVGRTIGLKLRYEDFSLLSRSRTLDGGVDSAQVIYATAVSLLGSLGVRPMKVRLIGLRVEQLESADQVAVQLTLDGREDNWRSAEAALDAVSARFGQAKIGPARLLKKAPPAPDAY